MDEAEWLASDDPAKMLRWRQTPDTNWFPDRQPRKFVEPPGKFIEMPSDRKLRLFAVACCRSVWHLLVDERNRQAVEVAERFADSQSTADGDEMVAIRRGAGGAARYACMNSAKDAARFQHQGHSEDAPFPVQTALLRDLLGNPFRKTDVRHCSRCGPPSPDGSDWGGGPCPHSPLAVWLAWNGGTVRRLAESIYQERAFDRMPILADALEEAGCTAEEILRHCRGWERCWNCLDNPACGDGEECKENSCIGGWRKAGPHVRGCWVIDLLTGRS